MKKDLFTMEVIADELKKNGVNVDIETLSEHIQYILGNYRDCFNESVEAFDSRRITIGRFSRNECKHLRTGNVLLDACLPHESYFQRRYSTSSCPLSCTCDKEHWKN